MHLNSGSDGGDDERWCPGRKSCVFVPPPFTAFSHQDVTAKGRDLTSISDELGMRTGWK